jgi:hypothetical protein
MAEAITNAFSGDGFRAVNAGAKMHRLAGAKIHQ